LPSCTFRYLALLALAKVVMNPFFFSVLGGREGRGHYSLNNSQHVLHVFLKGANDAQYVLHVFLEGSKWFG